VYALTPSFQQKWFEVSVPVSIISYHHLAPRVGLCVRAGWFFLGGDALGGIFGLSDMEGMDFYGGVHIFFPKHKLRDNDSDFVSNKLDSCPKERGPCISHGCPDRDGDGIIDKLDRCPDNPGPAYLHGCPDRDNDSIADLDDSCPDIKGLIQFHGCPDTDDDGIPDPQDSCPTVKGLPQFNGCPDTDGDGIPDSRDSCPLVKGLPQFHGCPDRDGDGIPDSKDKCPDVPGVAQYDGCPAPVVVVQDDMSRIQLSSQSILFKTGSPVLEPNVYQVLDQIAAIMLKYPNAKWRVEGYCDITGSDKINLDLSNRRAEAVRDYLVKKGVKSENIASYGYGKTHFIATNATAAGRAKNRRVEIKEEK
jgi:outer membrane protein OmpA-like peptidoglycan-associated protein